MRKDRVHHAIKCAAFVTKNDAAARMRPSVTSEIG